MEHLMPISDAKLGAIIRKALAAEGHVIKPMPKAKKPWHFDAERWDRQEAKRYGMTVERLQGAPGVDGWQAAAFP